MFRFLISVTGICFLTFVQIRLKHKILIRIWIQGPGCLPTPTEMVVTAANFSEKQPVALILLQRFCRADPDQLRFRTRKKTVFSFSFSLKMSDVPVSYIHFISVSGVYHEALPQPEQGCRVYQDHGHHPPAQLHHHSDGRAQVN